MNVLELFPCSGGLAEGFRRAGLAPTMAFDFDKDACDSYAANHGQSPIRMDVRDLVRMVRAGWSAGDVDLLIADPPCTPWSRAGKRTGVDDERDMLIDTVEIVRLLQPRTWLIANVPGLDDEPNWPIVQRTIGSLGTLGAWCIDFSRLDAASFGVPQHRIRPFWFGHRRDTPCLMWPTRTHGSPEECAHPTLPGVEPLKPWVTCRQALGHLQPDELGTPVRLRWRGCNSEQQGSVPDRPARVVGTSNLSDGNVLVHHEAKGRSRHAPGHKARNGTPLDEPAQTIRAKQDAAIFEGPNHRPSRDDRPARTLTRNTHGDGALLVVDHHPPSNADEPSRTIRASTGGTPDKILRTNGKHPMHDADEPAHTIRGCDKQKAQLLTTNRRHPINTLDSPSYTVTTKGDGRGAQGACVLSMGDDAETERRRRPSRNEGPARTMVADGRQGARLLEWPWDRPATAVCCDDDLPPPGHHDETFRVRTLPGAVKLTEKAASILQGFPPGWTFCGATKRSRWSQIGMAMPPPMAEAVAKAVAAQLAATGLSAPMARAVAPGPPPPPAAERETERHPPRGPA